MRGKEEGKGREKIEEGRGKVDVVGNEEGKGRKRQEGRKKGGRKE